ncbi:TetR family transcriptional regulator [Amycolatopsis sp. FDAARGOS 1241]|uniref:TetR family transcriptional regulator n=1 Tax=Amycolatopsis sp. FDAARGOS 1241 TaxID=2778070 RepID=UPI0019507029|nr:TetR family transcriptional regulator [Amycolatopsis sp. FDAARGOS 1241]QRP45677.1 TetR family transcriptional regulator [Amycolatopsis sp. FDAARGOS 1241]
MDNDQPSTDDTPAGDAAATGRRILDAAPAEFSEAGLAGGRVGRIAARARANQRMIYAYFGSKDGLFEAVLTEKVLQAQNAVVFDAEDLSGYACQIFDFYRAHPHLVRLNLWQALERPDLLKSLAPVERAMADKVAGIAAAQAAGKVSTALPAERVLDLVLSLTYGNVAQAGNAAAWTDDQRAALATAVTRLTSPR